MRKILAVLSILMLFFLTACSGVKAKKGDKVKVDYTGTLEDGSTFDSSVGKKPLEFTLGEGKMIKGFEDAVYGMQANESKKFTIPAAEAYGDYDETKVVKVTKDKFPKDMVLEVGKQLQTTQQSGQVIRATILKIEENEVTLDTNHPLAGKNLTFEIKLLEITEPTK